MNPFLSAIALPCGALPSFVAFKRARLLHNTANEGWATDAFWLGVLWALLALDNLTDLVVAVAA